MRENTKVFFIRFFLFALFLYGGAFMFMSIEEDEAAKEAANMAAKMTKIQNFTSSKYNMTEKEFNELVNKLKSAACSDPLHWSFFHATSFTLQVLTTIGYGNLTPRTKLGQIVTIVYALFGIPITVLMLKSAGEGYNRLMKCIIIRLEKCKKGNLQQDQVINMELKILVLNICLLVAVIVGAAASSLGSDKWDLVEGIYAWFITVTTVGFGDYIPNAMLNEFQPNGLIIPGLCLMSGVVDAMVNYINKANVKVFRCRGSCVCCQADSFESQVEEVETQTHSANNLAFDGTEPVLNKDETDSVNHHNTSL